MSLTIHQQKALDHIKDFLESPEEEICIQGYAGTGKTFMCGPVVKHIAKGSAWDDEQRDVILCAPTNKATKILSDKSGRIAKTIHSLLGIKMEPDYNGDYRPQHYPDRSKIENYGVAILDEASMIDKKLYEIIREKQSLHSFKTIYIGDPAQLPPVKYRDSPVFSIAGPLLTEVVRQKANSPILQLATLLRKDLLQSKGIAQIFPHKNDSELAYVLHEAPLLERAIDSFKKAKHADECKILAYRNECVRNFNQQIRKALHGECIPEYVVGEWVTTMEPIIEKFDGQTIMIAGVSTELDVIACWKHQDGKYTIWEMDVEFLNMQGKEESLTIQTLAQESKEQFDQDLEALAQRARASENRDAWKPFYNLKERYTRIGYSYSITIHKSQGSTFDQVFLFEPDLARCPDGTETQNKLKYTAVTRPSQRLVVQVGGY